jgi:ankyrin repeat protein
VIRTTALQAAAAADETAIARLLLEAGADANVEQPDGFTALDSAIQNGNDELRELLLAHGATPRP